MSGFNYEKDANGVVTVTMDMDGPVNSMSEAFLPALRETVEKLEGESDLTGVVLASAKKTFFAGGDLNSLCQVTEENAETFFNEAQAIKAEFRRLEKLGKPTVAAINGRDGRLAQLLEPAELRLDSLRFVEEGFRILFRDLAQ